MLETETRFGPWASFQFGNIRCEGGGGRPLPLAPRSAAVILPHHCA